MKLLYLILNFVALVLLLILLINLIKNFFKSKHKLQSLKVFSLYFIVGIAIIAIPNYIMNTYVKEPKLETVSQKISFYKKHQQYIKLHKVYAQIMIEKQDSLALNFNYINTVQKYISRFEENNKFDYKYFMTTYIHYDILNTYKSQFKGKKQDIPNLFLALHHTNLKKYKLAEDHLSKVVDKESYYYHYISGKRFSKLKDFSNSEKHLLRALKISQSQKHELNELAFLYYYFRKSDKLKDLINQYSSNENLNSFYKEYVYFNNFMMVKYWKNVFQNEFQRFNLMGFISSLIILMIWLYYLRRIDVYELESWFHTFFVLFSSMVTIFFVYPLHDFLYNIVEFYPSNNVLVDFIQQVVSIGMIEEIVKAIPVLLLLKFSKKAINEPYDYIYYFSISALGFAFIENIGYIQESSLYNINARALMASVAHIVFSSTIGYGMMLSKFRKHKKPILTFILFYLLASSMHAFYDFWLINNWAKQYEWITIIYFLVSIHIWHVYSNNTLNISPFYNDKIKINNDKVRYYIIYSLVFILMISWVFNGFARGKNYANNFLVDSILYYGYFILYLAFSFSRFEIIRGYIKPFNIPFRLLLPKSSTTTDHTNTKLTISQSTIFFKEEFKHIQDKFPCMAILTKRIVLDNNLECYLALIDTPLQTEKYINDLVLLVPKVTHQNLNSSKKILVQVLLISATDKTINKQVYRKEDFTLAGIAISKKLN